MLGILRINHLSNATLLYLIISNNFFCCYNMKVFDIIEDIVLYLYTPIIII